MQKIFTIINKGGKKIQRVLLRPIDKLFTWFKFYSNGIKFSTFRSNGTPHIDISLGGTCNIGNDFKLNNREFANPIGRFRHCSIVVGKKGELKIGNNVGMSSSAIVCLELIEIGDNVNLGGNVVIYDTDFHSLNASDRRTKELDLANTKTKPVIIGNNVFIGAHTTILKGVTIGDNSIIGACSVVTKSIPENEIWAGNPARMIKKV